MIVSFSNNFIFVKTRKTGGTSVEMVLSTWCAPGDVCSRLMKVDEAARLAMGGEAGREEYRGHKVWNHMPAAELRRLFGDIWEAAFKFTVERHPYEKAVSRAYWNIFRRGGDAGAEFGTEIETVIASGSFTNIRSYASGEKLLVDEVIDYARLWPRLGEIGERMGKRLPDPLPHAKSSHRKDRRPAAEILTEAQKDRIHAIARREFELLGFER